MSRSVRFLWWCGFAVLGLVSPPSWRPLSLLCISTLFQRYNNKWRRFNYQVQHCCSKIIRISELWCKDTTRPAPLRGQSGVYACLKGIKGVPAYLMVVYAYLREPPQKTNRPLRPHFSQNLTAQRDEKDMNGINIHL